MKKRILILCLVALMMLLPLVGCNRGKPNEEETLPTTDLEDSPSDSLYDSKGYLKDSLPTDLNYDDEIKVLHWTESDILEFNPDKETPYATEKAILARDRKVEERLGITFKWMPTKGHWTSENSFVNTVVNAFNGGEQTRYDIIATYSQSAAILSTRGLVLNLKENEYIDFKKPWWPSSLTENFTINDQLFFASGDLSTTFLSQMIGVYFNKEYFLDQNLYDLVYDNEWTIDKMLELAEDTFAELDQTGNKSYGDMHGVICPWEIYFDGFFYGSDLVTVEHKSNGELCVSGSYIGERADDLTEKLKTLFHDSDDGWLTNDVGAIEKTFAKGNGAFMVAPGVSVLTLKAMQDTTVDYGMLPIPKYNSQQKEYKTVCTSLISLYCIFASSTAEQESRAGAVLECLASEGHRELVPVLFEECLKTRYAKDNDAGKMYDIIRAGVVFDVGRVYSRAALGDITTVKWQRCVIDGDKAWGAIAPGVDAQLQNLLDKLQTSFDSMQ